MKKLSAIALSALLLSASVGYAQTAADAPAKATVIQVPPYTISAGEVAAVGVGVLVGASLAHATIGHGLMLAGAAVGGWVGDWWYNAPAQQSATAK